MPTIDLHHADFKTEAGKKEFIAYQTKQFVRRLATITSPHKRALLKEIEAEDEDFRQGKKKGRVITGLTINKTGSHEKNPQVSLFYGIATGEDWNFQLYSVFVWSEGRINISTAEITAFYEHAIKEHEGVQDQETFLFTVRKYAKFAFENLTDLVKDYNLVAKFLVTDPVHFRYYFPDQFREDQLGEQREREKR